MSLLQFGNSWATRASEAGPPLSVRARALSPSGNTEVLVQEGKARGFRESGPASTAPRSPVASDYKGPHAVQSLSLHPVLVPRTLLPALCPGLAMAPTLPLLLALVTVVIPGESEVGSLLGISLWTPGGICSPWPAEQQTGSN